MLTVMWISGTFMCLFIITKLRKCCWQVSQPSACDDKLKVTATKNIKVIVDYLKMIPFNNENENNNDSVVINIEKNNDNKVESNNQSNESSSLECKNNDTNAHAFSINNVCECTTENLLHQSDDNVGIDIDNTNDTDDTNDSSFDHEYIIVTCEDGDVAEAIETDNGLVLTLSKTRVRST